MLNTRKKTNEHIIMLLYSYAVINVMLKITNLITLNMGKFLLSGIDNLQRKQIKLNGGLKVTFKYVYTRHLLFKWWGYSMGL